VSRRAVLAAALCGALFNGPAPAAPQADHAFAPIARVLQHPRCLNCHGGDFPRQTEQGTRHSQHVQRGADGRGAPAMRCASCHQAGNQGRVPGVAGWRMPPRSMDWQGLGSATLCRRIQDPRTNGGRASAEAVIEHLRHDPLVLWAWQPGADRAPPPLSHAEFLRLLEHWAALGMPCPAPGAVR
jgi:hypothetical protein